MATIYGIVKDENNAPVEFATVFSSDSKGVITFLNKKSATTTTDDKGRFKLDNYVSDYVSVTRVGLKKANVPISSATKIPSPMGDLPTLFIKMTSDKSVNLDEVVVKPKDDKPNTSEPIKATKDIKRYIPFIIGGIVVLGVIIFFIVNDKNKKQKNK